MVKAKLVLLKKKKLLIPGSHTEALRYYTDNAKVASVSQLGEIVAKAKGSCRIYALAPNGVKARIKVTVQ